MQHLAVDEGAPRPVDRFAGEQPGHEKKSGMRKGLAKATTSWSQPFSPTARPTPSAECIVTTSTIDQRFA